MGKHLTHRLETIKELLQFFWKEKMWWLIPLVVVLLIMAVLIGFAHVAPILPFLYTAF